MCVMIVVRGYFHGRVWALEWERSRVRILSLSTKVSNVVGNFDGISSRTKILGMHLIKSQKAIKNTLNLHRKSEREKTTEREREVPLS